MAAPSLRDVTWWFSTLAVRCRERAVPCLHFSPVTADSSVRRPSPAPGRSIFFMVLAVLPVVLSLRFRSITVQNRFALYLRCGLGDAPESSVFPGLSCRHGTARCRRTCDYGGSSCS
ncbi:TPA: DUF1472 domain-containing protein [Escherichia coli]|nr:DUF1472 domain-containing protein [Escherichia coli]HAM4818611.1 DUF1472 domain-containing protein [Escherichia coli]HAM4823325.1 DUF1472 domain-containing protein [Escherichia coli]HAM4842185.1 DUF1472 domain-containing protein [Escherichia coli]HAM4861620.1 DUF1472 domain-containing protein [Escherichia coli]